MAEEKFDILITIKEVYEQDNLLRVIVETPYGIDNIGLSPDKKYLDPVTNQPRFLKEVKEMIENKYKPKKAVKKELYGDLKEKSLMFSEIEQSLKVPGFVKRLVQLGLTRKESEEVMEKYPNHNDLRNDVLAGIDLGFKGEVKERLEDYYGGDNVGFTKSKFKNKEAKK